MIPKRYPHHVTITFIDCITIKKCKSKSLFTTNNPINCFTFIPGNMLFLFQQYFIYIQLFKIQYNEINP